MVIKSKTLATLMLGALLATLPEFAVMPHRSSAIAQTIAQFSLPDSLPSGTKVKIDGDESMAVVSQALKQAYQGQFAGTEVELANSGTDAALQNLLAGTVDIAATGRLLTDAEKAQGLTPVVLNREKIAIVVSEENAFSGDIGFEQFAKLFRGEITDWSELGGPAGAIRFVDRPESSDTRQSLSTYPVFQTAEFAAGANAEAVADDNTAAVVKSLGADGVGYAIYSQVKDLPGIKVIPMHKVLPDNPAYPYSQPRVYVYKGEPNPAVQSFLGLATSPAGEAAVATAAAAEAAAVAEGQNPTGDEAVGRLSAADLLAPDPNAAADGADAAADAENADGEGADAESAAVDAAEGEDAAAANAEASDSDAAAGEGTADAAAPESEGEAAVAPDAPAGGDGTTLEQGDAEAAASDADNKGKRGGFPLRGLLPLVALAAGGGLLWWLAAAKDEEEEEEAAFVEGSSINATGSMGTGAPDGSGIAGAAAAGTDAVGDAAGKVGLGIAGAAAGAAGLAGAAAAGMKGAATDAVEKVGDAATGVTDAGKGLASNVTGSVGDATGNIAGKVTDATTGAAANITDAAGTGIKGAGEMATGAVGGVTGTVGGVADKLSDGAGNIAGGVKDGVAGAAAQVGSGAAGLSAGAVAGVAGAGAAAAAFAGRGGNGDDEEGSIESILTENRLFYPSEEFSRQAQVKSQDDYHRLYVQAKADPEGFWADLADTELHWFKKWDKTLEWDSPNAKWFSGGKLNITYNCLDRHLETDRRNKPAIIWEGEPGDARVLTYAQLHREVCLFANSLKKLGVGKGDVVGIYMPMVPEAAIAMLACARIGAPHSVVFGGFSAEALRDRLNDGKAKLVITADGGWRKDKIVELKPQVDKALADGACPSVENVLVVQRTRQPITMESNRDHWWHDLRQTVPPSCPAEPMDSEDVLFILYTSGSTGKPKGVVHTTGGYNLYTHMTTKWIFDLREDDVYWCTADVGWITGHSYIVYGPLSNGASTLMYEGAPRPSNPGCFWDVVEKYKVSIFYTAPTAVRAFIKMGEDLPKARDLSSLRLLGTVGEPINPEAWMWYHRVIGGERCPIVDTWWQTETGGVMITSLPGAVPTKPGSAARPFPGIIADVVDKDGKPVENNQGGYLIVRHPWPSMIRGVYGDPERFRKTYFEQIPGQDVYFAGDGARIDEDGYFWVMGRVDDVISVSGHRLGTMEIESALVSHPAVAEAAVVGRPDDLKGEEVYAFITLEGGQTESDALVQSIKAHVVQEIGALARPGEIQFTDALPKTRSGKIMRRLLRKVASGEEISGDTSTLEDRSVLDKLRSGE